LDLYKFKYLKKKVKNPAQDSKSAFGKVNLGMLFQNENSIVAFRKCYFRTQVTNSSLPKHVAD